MTVLPQPAAVAHSRRWVSRWAVVYAAGLAFLVLTPISRFLIELTLTVGRGWSDSGMPGHPGMFVIGSALNVVLFVPFGYAGAVLTGRRWYVVAAVAFAVSGCIELVQLLPALHRDASLADVVCNGLGGLIGAWAADVARARGRRRRA